MGYDPDTRTIIPEKEGIEADMGSSLVHFMQTMALEPNASQSVKAEWSLLSKWLGCQSGTLGPAHFEKFKIAWNSYLAKGKSPSRELDTFFVRCAIKANQEKWTLIDIPKEIESIFERMIATDEEIKAKRQLDLERAAKAKAVFNAARIKAPDSSFKSRLNALSKTKKAFLVSFVIWFPFVILRTGGSIQLLGIYLRQWESDYFFLNLFAPFVVAAIACVGVKWIMRKQSI